MRLKNSFCRQAAVAVILAASVATAAYANPASHMGSGHATGKHMADRFDQMDTNGDGKVVLEEFRAAFPNMSEQAFAVIDVNGNKSIERSEWLDFTEGHARGNIPGMSIAPRLNNIPGDPLIPPPDSNDLPLMRPPNY